MSATADLLERDDAVDALTDLEVKDAWARGQLMHAVIDAQGPAWMRSDECDDVQGMLEDYSPAGLKQAAIVALGRHHPLGKSLGWEDGPGNVETLFDRLTTDDKPESELVDVARRQLKNVLRGCGMPRIAVMRRRVRDHAGL